MGETKKASNARADAKKAIKIEPDMIITKLVPGNPRREGTQGHDRLAVLKSGMTVEKFLQKGGYMKDLRWELERERIALTKK